MAVDGAAIDRLTALSGPMSLSDARHRERSSAATMSSRLRTEGTDHRLAAGRAAGHGASSRRASARSGGPAPGAGADRGRSLDPEPPGPLGTMQLLLREVFDDPYDRIAAIVGTSEQPGQAGGTWALR